MVNQESNPASNLESKAEWKNAAFILSLVVAESFPGLAFQLYYRDHIPATPGFSVLFVAWMLVVNLTLLVVPFFWRGGMNPARAIRRFGSGRTMTNVILGLLPVVALLGVTAVFHPRDPHISQFSMMWDQPSGQGGMIFLWLLPFFLAYVWIPLILSGIRSELTRTLAVLGYFLFHVLESIISQMGANRILVSGVSSAALIPVLTAMLVLGLARIGRRDNLGVTLFLVSLLSLLFVPMPGIMYTQVPVYLVAALVIWITSFMPSRHPSLTSA